MLREPPEDRGKGVNGVAREDSGPAAASVAAWFGLRAEDRGAAAVALHALRGRAARIVAGRCRCSIAVAEDHVADLRHGLRHPARAAAPHLRHNDSRLSLRRRAERVALGPVAPRAGDRCGDPARPTHRDRCVARHREEADGGPNGKLASCV